ncbi:unnamed protein product [Rotaria magnacalcarata]|uniref:Uncharacterized protein n=1 Tax=Rotaria magnacalcarata TaxID=392030 RepID=A0A819LN61_9BILA|nr:unnamed protein product [Rotaria magnacalcarata]CAF3829209.1 unnamed protein product [Rotaria magnacalcarata]CAF3969716.1 unnamed protein product [Rotaria magnacalcarata]CAF3984726.1 unnamed protein product [Rotaria magnacalcarata]
MEKCETTKAVRSTGAVEIDFDEHIYSHPEYTQKLYDHHGFSAQTLYELIEQAVQHHFNPTLTHEALRILNFMPLAHMFGCSTIVIATSMDGEIGFWQGNANKLINEFNDFRPNLLTMVPRLLNKLYDTVMSETSRKDHLSKSDFIKMAIQSDSCNVRE